MSFILFKGKEGSLLGDRFRLLCEIGIGSFGHVWKAVRLSDGQVIALKIPKDQEKGEEILRREPELIKDIEHPNIVKVFDYHNVGDLFLIEMEYIEGHDLGQILDGVNASAPLSFRQVVTWAIQVLEGLQVIHEAQISHNDLKPQNILIEERTGTAKIADFGTSRRLEDVWVWTKRQGTEAYMAPEVALEGKRGRYVSDIYSLGVVLYEMITGRLPYSSPHQLLVGAEIVRPREINSDISPELERVALRAMERRPEKRYSNAAGMRQDLEACLGTLESDRCAGARTLPSQVPFRPPSTSPLHYLELAKQKLSDNDLQGALEAAETAVERSDKHPQYLRMLGGICMRLGYFQKAGDAYEQVLAAYTRGYPAERQQCEEVLDRLGEIYTLQQKYDKALRFYEQRSQLSGSPLALFRTAIAAGLSGHYDQAIQLLERVRKARPEAVVVYSKLGWAHALNGDDRLAISYYNQALAMDGHDGFSLYQLGQYYFLLGDRRRANEYFSRLAAVDFESSYSERVRKLIKE